LEVVAGTSSTREIVQQMCATGTDIGQSLDSVGEGRISELICHSTVTMWCESSTIASPSLDLCDTLLAAQRMAKKERRYRDVRILVNRAGDLYHNQLQQNPAFVLLSLLDRFSMNGRPKSQKIDPLAIFRAHALELTMTLYGPNHPAAVVLSHLSDLGDTATTAIQAVQGSITTIVAKHTSPIALQTVATLRLQLADLFEVSGYLVEAKNIRLDLMENVSEPEVHGRYARIDALVDVARHYLNHEPDSCDEAERLFSQIYDEGVDSLTDEVDPYNAYCAYWGLAEIAYRRNNLKAAEWYYTQRIYAARQTWGEVHTYVLISIEKFADFLEEQERYDEAEKVRNSFQLVDDMEAMSLNPGLEPGSLVSMKITYENLIIPGEIFSMTTSSRTSGIHMLIQTTSEGWTCIQNVLFVEIANSLCRACSLAEDVQTKNHA
jgi:hypothetical protein